MIPKALIKSKNMTDLTIELTNGSIIALKGAEDADNLRGKKVHRVVLEEAAYMKAYVWTDILRASLADTMGEALFISTPRGANWFHKLYQLGVSKTDPEWASFHFTIYDNPHIPPSEIEKIKASPEISSITWRQEYLAEVFANVGQVYCEFDLDRNTYTEGESNVGLESWPCVRGMDYGNFADSACAWLHIAPTSGKIVMPREYVKNNQSVDLHADAIKTITGPRRVGIGNTVLDRSAFRTEGTSGTSISKQFAKEGIVCVPSERDVSVGVDIFKRCLENGWFQISTACTKLIDALQNYEYGSHEPDIIAATRYALVHIYRRNLSEVFKNVVIAEPNEPEPETVKIGADGTRFLRIPENRDLRWDYDNGVPLD